MPNNFVDLSGQQFGALTVVSLWGTHSSTLHHSRWVCRCPCGKHFLKTASNLQRGKNVGCPSCYRAHRQLHPFESKYNALVRLSNGRVPVGLTYEDFLEFTRIHFCHYCGADVGWHPYKAHGYRLDRKDNRLGYTQDNCVVCCPRCNRAKSDHFTYDEWVQIGALIRSWKK